jgi:hypothetical protein
LIGYNRWPYWLGHLPIWLIVKLVTIIKLINQKIPIVIKFFALKDNWDWKELYIGVLCIHNLIITFKYDICFSCFFSQKWCNPCGTWCFCVCFYFSFHVFWVLFLVENNFSKINLNWDYIKFSKTYCEKNYVDVGFFCKIDMAPSRLCFFSFLFEWGPPFPRSTWLGATLVLQKPTKCSPCKTMIYYFYSYYYCCWYCLTKD